MKKIAFYAPLKPADHPQPSGDRLMARQLIALLRQCGHQVDVASDLRVFLRDAEDVQTADRLRQLAGQEVSRLRGLWQQSAAPDVWFCYHPYVKSPDLIGPVLCREFGLDYVSAEASWSARRNQGVWRESQAEVLTAIRQAAVNICLTERDHRGLSAAAPTARLARLRPFIDTRAFAAPRRARPGQGPSLEPNANPNPNPSPSPSPSPSPGPGPGPGPEQEPVRLLAVAMMRSGDKLRSYQHLAAVLSRLQHLPWQMSIVGDGPRAEQVRQMFAGLPEARIHWHGKLAPERVVALLADSSLFVWPGCGEAYGLAYLEAQAAGVPVVAWATAGVPEVVKHGVGGLLVSERDEAGLAAALGELIVDAGYRQRLSESARSHVRRHHDQAQAVQALQRVFQTHLPGATEDRQQGNNQT